MSTVVLVGESNPYGSDPKFALFDKPEKASGFRLRTRVLGVDRQTYFGFRRHNLVRGPWSMRAARVEARVLDQYVYPGEDVRFVLLGRKVATAFGYADAEPFSVSGLFVLLPHPSGLCREWNVPGAYERARDVLRLAVPDVSWGMLDVPDAGMRA